MTKQRIQQIIEHLPKEDHELHELNKWLRAYKLKNK